MKSVWLWGWTKLLCQTFAMMYTEKSLWCVGNTCVVFLSERKWRWRREMDVSSHCGALLTYTSFALQYFFLWEFYFVYDEKERERDKKRCILPRTGDFSAAKKQHSISVCLIYDCCLDSMETESRHRYGTIVIRVLATHSQREIIKPLKNFF